MLATKDIELVKEVVRELEQSGQTDRARAVGDTLRAATAPAFNATASGTDEFLTVGQASDLLGVSRQVVRRLVAKGQLEGVRIAGRLFLVRHSVVEQMDRRPVTGPSRPDSSSADRARDRALHEAVMAGLPPDKLVRLEELQDKRLDGQPLTRAERAEWSRLDRELRSASTQRLRNLLAERGVELPAP